VKCVYEPACVVTIALPQAVTVVYHGMSSI
jgi:hypothetical protein